MHLVRLRLDFETPSKSGNPVGGGFTVSALQNTSCCRITKGRFFTTLSQLLTLCNKVGKCMRLWRTGRNVERTEMLYF